MGMQEVEARNNIRRFNFVKHLFQAFLTLGVKFPITIILSAVPIAFPAVECVVIYCHHSVSTLFAVMDMLIHSFRRQLADKIRRSTNMLSSATFYPPRQVVILFQLINAIQKVICFHSYQCGFRSLQFYFLQSVRRKYPIASPAFGIDDCFRTGC